jgi:hypothetical protein
MHFSPEGDVIDAGGRLDAGALLRMAEQAALASTLNLGDGYTLSTTAGQVLAQPAETAAKGTYGAESDYGQITGLSVSVPVSGAFGSGSVTDLAVPAVSGGGVTASFFTASATGFFSPRLALLGALNDGKLGMFPAGATLNNGLMVTANLFFSLNGHGSGNLVVGLGLGANIGGGGMWNMGGVVQQAVFADATLGGCWVAPGPAFATINAASDLHVYVAVDSTVSGYTLSQVFVTATLLSVNK